MTKLNGVFNPEGIEGFVPQPETKEYDKLILEVSMNIISMGRPSINPKFKKEIISIINKYYPNWKTIDYRFND